MLQIDTANSDFPGSKNKMCRRMTCQERDAINSDGRNLTSQFLKLPIPTMTLKAQPVNAQATRNSEHVNSEAAQILSRQIIPL